MKFHTLLETETIHASLLRHKLQFFPGEIEKEIVEALQSARHSNAEELKNLQASSSILTSLFIFETSFSKLLLC